MLFSYFVFQFMIHCIDKNELRECFQSVMKPNSDSFLVCSNDRYNVSLPLWLSLPAGFSKIGCYGDDTSSIILLPTTFCMLKVNFISSYQLKHHIKLVSNYGTLHFGKVCDIIWNLPIRDTECKTGTPMYLVHTLIHGAWAIICCENTS